jgi:hypothetical protein
MLLVVGVGLKISDGGYFDVVEVGDRGSEHVLSAPTDMLDQRNESRGHACDGKVTGVVPKGYG